MLDRYPSSTVHNIDRDAAALSTSQTLCQKLGYDRMTFSREDITEDALTTKWEDFDVVFLAALVGCDTTSKIDILKSLAHKLKAGTLVVARSAKGLREVLYPVSRHHQYHRVKQQAHEANTSSRFWSFQMTWRTKRAWKYWWKCIRGQKL
jgi:precorrin-6B methylase 2